MLNAMDEEKLLRIRYEGWTPSESPLDAFDKIWVDTGLFTRIGGKKLRSNLDDFPESTARFYSAPGDQFQEPQLTIRLQNRGFLDPLKKNKPKRKISWNVQLLARMVG